MFRWSLHCCCFFILESFRVHVPVIKKHSNFGQQSQHRSLLKRFLRVPRIYDVGCRSQLNQVISDTLGVDDFVGSPTLVESQHVVALLNIRLWCAETQHHHRALACSFVRLLWFSWLLAARVRAHPNKHTHTHTQIRITKQPRHTRPTMQPAGNIGNR